MKVLLIVIFQLLAKYSSFKTSIKKNNFIFKDLRNDDVFKLIDDDELETYNYKTLKWYPVGFTNNFKLNIKQFPEINKKRYVVWKDINNFYGLRDACCHMGSSFQGGKNTGCLISCPYHGYTFNGTSGKMVDIELGKKNSLHVANHKVIEKNGIVYLNIIEGIDNGITENDILSTPEEYKEGYRSVNLEKIFKNEAFYVTCNSIDIKHISTVHSFGNKIFPEPEIKSKTKYNIFHYKINYGYKAGTDSIAKKIYGFSDVVVESEFKYPDATIARVFFGDFVSTIYIQLRPINDIQTVAYVKAIRNYFVADEQNKSFFLRMYAKLINFVGDKLTEITMIDTLEEDATIIANLDKYEKKKFNFVTQCDTFPFLYEQIHKIFE
jgi:nitrite reductase/ring-hydroxylating ferredoxin subunit